MDGHRFDEFAKRLATAGTSRRRFLRGLGGTLGGAVLAGVGARRAGAAGQSRCPNLECASDPGVCAGTTGCVCCVFANGHSRCLAPAICDRVRGEVVLPPPPPPSCIADGMPCDASAGATSPCCNRLPGGGGPGCCADANGVAICCNLQFCYYGVCQGSVR